MARRLRSRPEIHHRDEHGRKQCVRCECWKDESEFSDYSRGADGKHYYCKQCSTDIVRERTYGVPMEDLRALLGSQGGVCAICGTEDFGKRGWVVDHDHTSGDIRWILCLLCNTGLGAFRDDPAILRNAANLLEGRGV